VSKLALVETAIRQNAGITLFYVAADEIEDRDSLTLSRY
jgi:hypothetical protein